MTADTRNLSTNAHFARDYGNNLSDDFGHIPPATAEENRRAGLTICAHAVDAEEAAELMGMLGLVETPVVERDSRRKRVRSRQKSGPRAGAQTPDRSRGLTDYKGVG